MRTTNQYRAIRPIRTAPDHEPVLAYAEDRWSVATRHGGVWITQCGRVIEPTRWAELPPSWSEAKRMGHPRTCECGECQKCIMREYRRAWRNQRKEKANEND